MMATDYTILLQDDETKEAEFSYFTSDMKDVHIKMQKRRSFFQTCSSEKSLLCLDLKKEEFMRCKPRAIDRIVEEPGKKFLCVEYGPEDQPMYWLLDFNDTRESLDEWETALRQMMELKDSFRERSKSDTSIIRRPSTNKPKRAVSAIQHINTISESPAENGLLQSSEGEPVVEPLDEAVVEAVVDPVVEPVSETAVVTPVYIPPTTARQSSQDSDTRDGASSDSDTVSMTGSEFSSIGSLKSQGEDELWKRECKLKKLQEERDKEFVEHEVSPEELHKLTLAEYEGCVYVSEVGVDTKTIYIGDKMLQVDSKNVNTAQEAINLIRILKAERQTQVIVRLERFPNGNVCVIGPEVRSLTQLGIHLEGNQIISTKCGAFRMSCDPAWVFFKRVRSTRSISAVNDHAVSLHSTTQEVVELINEALEEMSIVVFHVHPTEFLKELATSSSTSL